MELNFDLLNKFTNELHEIVNMISCGFENQNNKIMETSSQSPTNFLTVKEVADLMGMSEYQARKMFHDPEFPCCDYGKNLVVEDSALKHYFSKPRRKNESPYWRGNKKSN